MGLMENTAMMERMKKLTEIGMKNFFIPGDMLCSKGE